MSSKHLKIDTVGVRSSSLLVPHRSLYIPQLVGVSVYAMPRVPENGRTIVDEEIWKDIPNSGKCFRSTGLLFLYAPVDAHFLPTRDVLRCGMQSPAFPPSPEPYVDADHAAAFLSLSRKTLLTLGRTGRIPGHPIGQGARKIWRFRLTELSRWLEQETVKLDSHRGRNGRGNS
jgi:Helix-turn-helix domain